MNTQNKIIFFDGYCNLCNGFVDCLLKVDHRKQFQFASLQGETAKQKLKRDSTPKEQTQDFDTVIYLNGQNSFERSTAVLLILSELGGIWRLAKIFLILPLGLRDLVYKFVAKNRFLLFGKREVCRIPTPEESSRLLP